MQAGSEKTVAADSSTLRSISSPQPSPSYARPALPLGAVALAVWLAWAWLDGGHSPAHWGPLGIVLLAALAIALLTLRLPSWRAERGRLVMSVALLAFAGWSFLSLLWADFRGDAWHGADKTLLYVAAFSLFALMPWSYGAAVRLLAAFSLGVAAIGAFVLARAASSDPAEFFADGRLVAPTTYANANVAFWMLAFWPALYLGSTRALPGALRPLFLGSAALLLDLAILGESRGWLFAFPLTAVVFVALARQRLRASLALAVVATSALAILGSLVAVYGASVDRVPTRASVERAALLVLLSCLVVAAAGAVWSFLDSRIALPRRVVRAIGVAVAIAALAAAATGAARAGAAIDDPRRWVAERWTDFTCSYCPSDETASRFSGPLSNDRYREWRVAWLDFLEHPLTGVGADNYAAGYVLRRPDAAFQPRYPHSTPLRLLGQLGLIGTALFAVGLAIAVALALRRRRALDAVEGGAVGAALTAFAYWLVHGSADWFWEIPALAAPAFGLLGLATSIAGSPRVGARPGRVAKTIIVGGLAVSAAAVALPWLASSLEEAAARTWRAQPDAAYRRLDLAARLNPLDADAALLKGSIALRRGDAAVARQALATAARREPRNWYAHLQLGLLAGSEGRFEDAERHIARARSLNPRDPGAALAQRLVERRASIDPRRLNDLYRREFERRVGGRGR